jgi:hypothetical protein
MVINFTNITNTVDKTRALLQTTEGEDEPNTVFYVEIVMDITTWNSEREYTKSKKMIN